MALPPIELENQAIRVENSIASITQSATTALPCGNYEIINLHAKAVRSGILFAEMATDGYTPEVLAPSVAASLGLTEEDFLSKFAAFKDTALPDFSAFVLANEDEILKRSFNGGDTPIHTSLTTETQNTIAPLIQAIINTFAS